MTKELGDEYHHKTKYCRDKVTAWHGPASRPALFKIYEKYLARIELPEVEFPANSSLWRALQSRRSRRSFERRSLPFPDLCRLIFAAQGLTQRAGENLLRTAPSAGALYPIETYLIINRVEGLDAGLYHLNLPDQCLMLLNRNNLEKEITAAALGQEMCATAAVNFIFTAIPDRSKFKYKERAWRYIYMDAAHICENLYLAAEDLELGCCGIGAFFDDEVNELLDIDGEQETVVYMAVVGQTKK